MAKVFGGFVAIVMVLIVGCFGLIGFVVTDPSTLCVIQQANAPVTELPTLDPMTEDQWEAAKLIVAVVPRTNIQLAAVAVAIGLEKSHLSTSSIVDGHEVTINPLTGAEPYMTVNIDMRGLLTALTGDGTWTSRPATEVVATAIGRPGADVSHSYEQGALIVAQLTDSDAQFLLDQVVKDPNCVYSQVPMGEVVTVDGVTFPVPGHTGISSRFGYRIHPIFKTRKLHSGVDFPAPCGTPIVPVKPGLVIRADQSVAGLGTLLEIEHDDGTVSWYGHMYPGTLYVREGQQVTVGQHIADVGSAGDSTGCHLHVELHSSSGAAVDIGRVFGWY